jgi:transcriptional regulator with XRE-family HTH domain
LSQESLARQANVSLNTVRKIETLQSVEPGVFTIAAIAAVLGLNLDELEALRPK